MAWQDVHGLAVLRHGTARDLDALFVEKFGHPRLRGRHMPFEIGGAERDQWVACMVLAMDDVGIEKTLSKKLLENFFHTADFMRNKEG